MVGKCRIYRKPGKSVPDETDLLNFADLEIAPNLIAIRNNEDYKNNGIISPQKVRMATISFLQTLGDRYVQSDHKYIEQAITELLEDPFYELLKQIIPTGTISKFLKFNGNAEEASHKIFTDQIFDDDANENDAVDYFLNNAYNQAISAKMELQTKMHNIILNSFIIDRKNGVIISNIEEASTKIIHYKKELFKEIQNFFKVYNITSSITETDIENTSIEKLINLYKKDISEQLQVGLLSGIQIQELYDNAYNNNNPDYKKNEAKAKLNAYGAWLALQHFDNFVKMTLGDTIIINPTSDTNRYSYSSKGTNVNTTYRKDDNYDLQAEINKLTQALINTSPMIQFGTYTSINGAYLQFSDFSYITSKIKDLVYDSKAASFFIDKEHNRALYESLSEDDKILVSNKSLRQIISNIRSNPQKYIPLVYKILTFIDNRIPIINQFSNFNSQDKNLLWSIYKNIYDSDFSGMGNNPEFHSLYSIQKENPDSKNYYSAISSVADCIFSVNFVQYYFEDGVLKLRTLRDASIDKTKSEIINIINTRNSNEFLGNFDFTPYNIETISLNDDRFDGISFKLKLDSGDLYVHVQNMGENIKFSKNPNKDGEALEPKDIKKLANDQSIKTFIDEVLGLNLARDTKFRQAYQELTAVEGDNITPYIKSLLEFSSQIFFNRYVAQTYVNNRPYRLGKIDTIKNLFQDEKQRPNFNNKFFNMEMVPKTKNETLKNLAQALGTTRGINSSRQVKDSDNAMLSSQTLSRLLGNLVQQFESQINSYNKLKELKNKAKQLEEQLAIDDNLSDRYELKLINQQIEQLKDSFQLIDNNQNPAGAHFSIINNPSLFKGMLKSEEIKGAFGNKKQVKFTTAEAVTSSFLHNFVLGHCIGTKSEFGDGIVGLLPSVNSDKTTVSIAKFDLNATINGTHQTYLQLSNSEIQQLIVNELGEFYKTMYSNVKNDFVKLTNWAYQNNLLNVLINPDDNFKALNKWVEEHNANPNNKKITASDKLFEITQEYNKQNPTNPIRLIDQIHYISDKNGKITFNNTIKDLNHRFSDITRTKEFFNLKNTEVLKSALDSDFIINLYGNSNLDKQPEINYLRENYGDWINPSGQMILARVNINGTIYDVSNKTDLAVLEKTLTMQRLSSMGYSKEQIDEWYRLNPEDAKQFCGYDNLINKMHLLKDNIILHPMLEKYNLMDYLFTQQIMASTVGSHVTHPVKGTFNNFTNIEQLTKDGFYKDSSELVTKISFVENIESSRSVAVAARFDRNTNTIFLNKTELYKKYLDKAWTKPAELKDGSYVEPIPEDEFESYDEWLTFILEHESAHRTNFQLPNETIGQYETRINNIALKGLRFKKQQALLAEEASRFYAQHKRNVSFTASMDQFQLNQKDGIPSWYNIAIIDDIKEGLFTVDGNTDSSKPYDGATYVNPIIMYLENNSLNEARAGIDKKQFVHFYDEMTGTGGIIKTAGFALTNNRMREDIFYRDMMKNMTDRVWKDYLGNDYVANILEDYNGKSIDYGTFYFKKGNKYYSAIIEQATAKQFRALHPEIELDPSISDDAIIPNSYIRYETEIDQYGDILSEPKPVLFKDVNTNYKLWELFGGMHSQEFNGNTLQPSETSLQNVVKAVVNVGKTKPGYQTSDITSEYIDQPLKNADIHYMPTIGAVKQGAANINPNSFYEGKHDLNFFRIRMNNAGIQLDKEHHANDSKLSLMTQVISSACSMGYTPERQDRLYKALYNLTVQGIKEFKSGLKEILNTKDPSKFETVIADCMIKTMMNSTAQDGDMLRAIATKLINKARQGEQLEFADTKQIPYSDPRIFDKLITTLSVMMTKSGIKAEMDGILSVLCPTQGIVKMYNIIDEEGVHRTLTLSQLENKYSHLWTDDDTNETFTQKVFNYIQEQQIKIYNDDTLDTNNISIGKKYKLKFPNYIAEDGSERTREIIIDLKYPHNVGKLSEDKKEIIGYKYLKNLLKNGHPEYGRIEYIQEYVKDGAELNSINYKFKGSDEKNYQIWDIDYIQDLFEVVSLTKDIKNDSEKLKLYEQLIIKYEGSLTNFNNACNNHYLSYVNKGNAISDSHKLKLAKLYAKQLQQNILFALSKNNPDKTYFVKIDGNDIMINKESIEVQPYEIVMPKIFLDKFGLTEYSNLDEIIKNPNYFYEKIQHNFDTIVQDETLYDLELKRINGDHVYIKDISGTNNNWNQDLEEVILFKKRDETGKLWRIDPKTNKKMYELFSDSDKIYKIPGTNTEIIATSYELDLEHGLAKSGMLFYLNNFKYQSLHISEAIAPGKNGRNISNERPKFEDILNLIKHSKNKTAQQWAEVFTGSEESNVNLNKEFNDISRLSDRLQIFLKDQSIKVHTSLLKSLDIIAARIPAQNQQSFMPMKVVAWENPNVNTAYVNVMQFFLQGSDLDIDAVSLLTHSFSKNGEFYAWSPDFNMENIDMLNYSMNLPFPTGNNLEIIAYDKTEEHVNEYDRNPLITNNADYQWLVENSQRFLNVENLDKEVLQKYINLLKFIEKNKGVIYVEKEADTNNDLFKKIINKINKHNTYLNNVSDNIIEGAIKNYVVGSLYSISTDSANLLEAHTSVDVATKPLKNIANESELSEVQKTFTPGNVFNKFQAIEEASVGKDDIAICATGLKAFFAATQFCNSVLNDNLQHSDKSIEEINEISNIVKFNDITIGGRTFKSLANIRLDNLDSVSETTKSSEIYKILKDKGFDEDASIVMSALLSLSTDNAKELCLAKINAGTGMLGMYLYGAAIGMDFDIMNKIIASPLGFTVAKLLNSNEFAKTRGKSSVDQALSYLFDGPSLIDLNKFNKIAYDQKTGFRTSSTFELFTSSINEVLSEKTASGGESIYTTYLKEILKKDDLKDQINEFNIGRILATLTRQKGSRVALGLLYKINQKVNNHINNIKNTNNFSDNPNELKSYESLNNQLHNFLCEFVRQAETTRNTKYITEYGDSDIKDDLNKLALGADEFKRLGQFLRLNQEIKTKPEELINFVLKFENCIQERGKLIKRVNERLGTPVKFTEKLEAFDFKKFAESFISDPDNPNAYHNKIIEIYEKNCKTCINPLRVLTTVPHYKGYLESMIMAYEGDYLKSIKFRAIKHLGNQFIIDKDVKNSSEKSSVLKGVQNFVDDYINNAYLSSQELFKLPQATNKNNVQIVDQYGKKIENKKNTLIKLGTERGNKTFELFFEEVFVKALKEKYPENLFVQDLKPVMVQNQLMGTKFLATSLPINMMPSSENEEIVLKKYRNDFNKLSSDTIKIGNIDYSIIQMFQFYSLLKFRGKQGKNSLVSIFEDLVANQHSDMISYNEFINNFDEFYDFRLNTSSDLTSDLNKQVIPVDEYTLYQYIAPLTNLESSAKIIKYKDINTGETILLQKKEKENQSSYSEDGDFDNQELNFMNDYEGDFEGSPEEYYEEDPDFQKVNYDNYIPNYGNYDVYQNSGALNKFNSTDEKINNISENVMDSYNTGQYRVQDVTISDGSLKYFTHNGERIVIDSTKKIVKMIAVQGEPIRYVLDKDLLNNMINQKFCQ